MPTYWHLSQETNTSVAKNTLGISYWQHHTLHNGFKWGCEKLKTTRQETMESYRNEKMILCSLTMLSLLYRRSECLKQNRRARIVLCRIGKLRLTMPQRISCDMVNWKMIISDNENRNDNKMRYLIPRNWLISKLAYVIRKTCGENIEFVVQD